MVVGRSDFSLRAAVRRAADARRVRGAVLRVGRHAARSARGRCERRARRRRRWPSCSSASRSRRLPSSCLLRYPLRVGAGRRRRRSRRSASSRSSCRRLAATSGCSRAKRPTRIVATAIMSIVINPIVFRAVTPLVHVARAPVVRPAPWIDSTADPERAARSDRRLSIDRRGLRTNRPHRVPAAAGERHSRDRGGLECRCDAGNFARTASTPSTEMPPGRHPGCGRGRHRRVADPDLGRHGKQHRGHSKRPGAQSGHPGSRARADLRDLPELTRAGADTVFTGEGEVALAFVESILDRLGATADQIDRERDRAHRELFGGNAT